MWKALRRSIEEDDIPVTVYVDERKELHLQMQQILEQRRHPAVSPAAQLAAANQARSEFLNQLPGEIYTPLQIELVLEWLSESQKTELIKKLLIGNGHGVGF